MSSPTDRYLHIAAMLRRAALCHLFPTPRQRAFAAAYWLHIKAGPAPDDTAPAEAPGSPTEANERPGLPAFVRDNLVSL